jgi:hypothetical protein
LAQLQELSGAIHFSYRSSPTFGIKGFLTEAFLFLLGKLLGIKNPAFAFFCRKVESLVKKCSLPQNCRFQWQ